MAVVGFLLIMPASIISDRLGRKWTIVPSCVAIASACLLMAATGALDPQTLDLLSCSLLKCSSPFMCIPKALPQRTNTGLADPEQPSAA